MKKIFFIGLIFMLKFQLFGQMDTVKLDVPLPMVIDTFVYNRELAFRQYYIKFIEEMDKQIISDFFYDPCFDYNNFSYCFVNAHEKKSLRKDFINYLNNEQIIFILKNAEIDKMKIVCNERSGLLYEDFSFWDLFVEEITKRLVE